MCAGAAAFAPVPTPFSTIGLGICYDLRFPEYARMQALAGADLIIYPAAWVDGPNKLDHWKTLLAARAIEEELFIAGVSRCDEGYVGHSCVFAPNGELISEGDDDEELVIAQIDTQRIAETRAQIPVLSHRRPDVYGQL